MEAKQGRLIRDVGRNVQIREPAEGNREYVFSHLREGDQREYDAAEKGGIKPITPNKEAYVWIGDTLIGRWASVVLNGHSELSECRGWGWETVVDADANKVKFARSTMAVFKAIWDIEDSWVKCAYVLPWSGYERTLKWQSRFFKQDMVGEVMIGGTKHLVYRIYRG